MSIRTLARADLVALNERRDRRIVAMWREGKHPLTIGAEIGLSIETVSRAILHHIASNGEYPS